MRAEGKDPEDFFLSLAASISDESKVDWDQAEESATGEHREVVHYLRAISRIAAANRTADWGLDAEEPGREEQQEGLGRWGHLELLEKIADGAFGEVYRARDPNLDCEMALKLLRRETSESPDGTEVICEGRLLAKVCHPNVAKVHGAERHWGRAGVWMEFIRGRNLEDLLEEQGRFGWDYATLIGQDLCRALAAVHQAGILHRDVKTKNVMREEGGRIVLMDFGLGRETWLLEQQEILSATGTPPYMAPELFRRQPPTTQSDIYSLGVVLFRLVSGRYPVEGNSYMDLSRAHEEGRRNLLSDVRPDLPEAFVRVVEKGIEADPSQRYASAGEFEHALASARGEIREEERRRSAPVRLLRGLGVAAAVTIVMLAWMVWGPGASYDVEAALFRVAGGGTEHLFPGATIAPGDQLLLEFEGSTDLHVYVVSRDDKGEAYLRMPMS